MNAIKCSGVIATLLCVTAQPVAGQDKDDMDYKTMSGYFIRCAGTYGWAAEVASTAGKPAVAEHMRGLGRGAKTAAAWSLAVEHNANHPKEQRSIGSWDGFIEPQIEIATNRVRALSEMDDQEAIAGEMEFCNEVDPLQAEIVNHIRSQIHEKNAGP